MFSRLSARLRVPVTWGRKISSTASRAAARPMMRVAASSLMFVGVSSVFLLTTTSGPQATECEPNYTAIRAELVKMIEDYDEKVADGTSIGPTLIRLAWHCSGTYSAKDKTGGSNGKQTILLLQMSHTLPSSLLTLAMVITSHIPLWQTIACLAYNLSFLYLFLLRMGNSGSTMRFPPEASWGANAGLQKARDFLAPLAAKYKMSVADVWTLAGLQQTMF